MDGIAALSSAMTLGQVQLAAATKVARIANDQQQQVLELLDAAVETLAPSSEPGLGENVDVYS
jgi:hypothetical protein